MRSWERKRPQCRSIRAEVGNDENGYEDQQGARGRDYAQLHSGGCQSERRYEREIGFCAMKDFYYVDEVGGRSRFYIFPQCLATLRAE